MKKVDVTFRPIEHASRGTQRCRLGQDLWKTLQVSLKDAVFISDIGRELRVLCRAWPAENVPDGSCLYDDLVSLTITGSLEDSLIPVQCIKLDEIHVTLMCSSGHSLREWRQTLSADKLKAEEIIKELLHDLALSRGFSVHTKKVQVGLLLGLDVIQINSISPQCEAGLLAIDADICIDSVELLRDVSDAETLPKLGGLHSQWTQLCRLVKPPCLIKSWTKGASIRNILLIGPQGSGKTSLVKAVAAHCNVPFITLDCMQLSLSGRDKGIASIDKIFERAILLADEGYCCVLTIDNLECLCEDKEARDYCLGPLVGCMQKVRERARDIVIVGITSKPASLDPLLRRSGSFSTTIHIGMPGQNERVQILQAISSDFPLSPSLDLSHLAQLTAGCVGSDLLSLCKEAFTYACLDKNDLNESVQITWENFERALVQKNPSVKLQKSELLVSSAPVSWNDIGGLDTVKLQVQQIVAWPIQHRDSYRRLGLSLPRGILLFGPPGCAKTMLVRAAASECHMTFISVSGGQLHSPYVGDSERHVVGAFEQARAGAPSILFFDEIDAVVGSRGSGGGERCGVVEGRVLSTLLTEIDGTGMKTDNVDRQRGDEDGDHVLLVAATNRPDKIDSALLRPGRIDRCIYVPPPDILAREQILQVHTRHMPMHNDVDLKALAERTDMFSGADLENLCREAFLQGVREEGPGLERVSMQHFNSALASMKPSLTKEQLQRYENMATRITSH